MFLLEEAEWYRDLVLEIIPNRRPVLTIQNATDTEVIEMDTLGFRDKNQYHQLLQDYGFQKKRRSEINAIKHRHAEAKAFKERRRQVLYQYHDDRKKWLLRFRMDIMQDVSFYTALPTCGQPARDWLSDNYDAIHDFQRVWDTGEAPPKL